MLEKGCIVFKVINGYLGVLEEQRGGECKGISFGIDRKYSKEGKMF